MPDIGLCAACKKTPLSAYNQGALCSTCERQAFSAANGCRQGMPDWIWETVPMRRMLAELNLGAAMHTFRLAAGLSQAEVANITGWSQSVISLIENGQRDTIFDVRNLLHMVDSSGTPREMLLPVILGHPAVFAECGISCPGVARFEDTGHGMSLMLHCAKRGY